MSAEIEVLCKHLSITISEIETRGFLNSRGVDKAASAAITTQAPVDGGPSSPVREEFNPADMMGGAPPGGDPSMRGSTLAGAYSSFLFLLYVT